MTRFVETVKQERPHGVAVILSRTCVCTLMLWIAYFMGVLVLYLITAGSKPSGKRPACHTVNRPGRRDPGGTLGAVVCGWLMSRVNGHRLSPAPSSRVGALIWVLGRWWAAFGCPALTFAAGTFTGAALVSMPTLAAAMYPTQARASGVGWMLGIGRLGGILGAVLGGVMLKAGLPTATIFALLAVPALIAGAALSYKHASRSNEAAPAGQSA